MRGFLIFQVKYWLAVAAAGYLAATVVTAMDKAHGQNGTVGSGFTLTVPPCQEKFRGLPKLAERLHVKEGMDSGGYGLRMCDGRAYDMFTLINALLDRMDKAAK